MGPNGWNPPPSLIGAVLIHVGVNAIHRNMTREETYSVKENILSTAVQTNIIFPHMANIG